MSTPIFAPGNFRKGYDGELRMTLDDGSASPIFSFPMLSVNYFEREGNAYPTFQDASAVRIDKVSGLTIGGLQVSGAVKIDRDFDQFLIKAFGPRATTGTPLLPFRAMIVPAAGITPVYLNGVYWDRLSLQMRFGADGATTMMRFSAQALVLDPLNTLGAGHSPPGRARAPSASASRSSPWTQSATARPAAPQSTTASAPS